MARGRGVDLSVGHDWELIVRHSGIALWAPEQTNAYFVPWAAAAAPEFDVLRWLADVARQPGRLFINPKVRTHSTDEGSHLLKTQYTRRKDCSGRHTWQITRLHVTHASIDRGRDRRNAVPVTSACDSSGWECARAWNCGYHRRRGYEERRYLEEHCALCDTASWVKSDCPERVSQST